MPCRSRRRRVCRVSSQRTVSALASSSSTRSVTSPRLPIGVAQTASGTAHRLRRAPRTRRGPRRSARPRPRARPRRSRSVSSAGWIASAAPPRGPARARDRPRRRRSRRRSMTTSGSKMLTSEPIAAPSNLPISASAPIAARRPRRARSTSTGASAPGPYSCAAARSAASPDAWASRCPRPWQFPWQGWPSGDDDDVPELGPAAVEVVVDDDAAADARPERQHDQVRHAPPGPETPLGECRGIAVVLDAGRQAVALARAVREVHVVEREVHRPQRDPVRRSMLSGTP